MNVIQVGGKLLQQSQLGSAVASCYNSLSWGVLWQVVTTVSAGQCCGKFLQQSQLDSAVASAAFRAKSATGSDWNIVWSAGYQSHLRNKIPLDQQTKE
jgi:hypothetical protein